MIYSWDIIKIGTFKFLLNWLTVGPCKPGMAWSWGDKESELKNKDHSPIN